MESSFDCINRILKNKYSDVTYVSAQVGVGSTTFALTEVIHFIKRGSNVLYVEHEMSLETVLRRLCKMNSIHIDESNDTVSNMLEMLPNMDKLDIIEMPIGENFSLIEHHMDTANKQYDIVIFSTPIAVNYDNMKFDNHFDKVKYESNRMREFSKKYNVAVMPFRQMNRMAFNSDEKTYVIPKINEDQLPNILLYKVEDETVLHVINTDQTSQKHRVIIDRNLIMREL